MGQICIEKVWHDEDLLEIEVSASNELISVTQHCYVDVDFIKEAADKIINYIYDYKNSVYMEFGKKQGNYTPAFSMNILPAKPTGHLKIEMDMEIDDNTERKHRACFYINTELGLLEQFGKKMNDLADAEDGKVICHL